MSLVNLSHVCSHLQNASLARLGLTSIPYTKLHLSLALLLHKQGFFSQVKLGGPSPPASCFPPGLRDNNSISSHPHIHDAESLQSPEAALQRVVSGPGPVTEEILRREGFGAEAIQFAMEERMKSVAQLEREGYANMAADFLLQNEDLSPEQLQAKGFNSTARSIILEHAPLLATARQEIAKWYIDQATYDEKERASAAKSERIPTPYTVHIRPRLRERILREGFSAETLRYFAGPQNSLRTDRDLARDGFTLTTMGLQVPNQPYQPPPSAAAQQDPWGLEAEGTVTQANRASRRLWLGMKYWEGAPVLRKAQMLSKPTKRIWLDAKELAGLTRGKEAAKGEVKPLTQIGEVLAVSTDKGIMEVRECAERRIGGMVLCRVW